VNLGGLILPIMAKNNPALNYAWLSDLSRYQLYIRDWGDGRQDIKIRDACYLGKRWEQLDPKPDFLK